MNGAEVCGSCGSALLGRPHPVAVHVDGRPVVRLVVCVRCRDRLEEALLDTFAAARRHPPELELAPDWRPFAGSDSARSLLAPGPGVGAGPDPWGAGS